MINEIASASEDQAQAVAQVTSGIEQISSVVQKNSATASESADASTELNSQAEKLQEQIRQFHLRDMDGRNLYASKEDEDSGLSERVSEIDDVKEVNKPEEVKERIEVDNPESPY